MERQRNPRNTKTSLASRLAFPSSALKDSSRTHIAIRHIPHGVWKAQTQGVDNVFNTSFPARYSHVYRGMRKIAQKIPQESVIRDWQFVECRGEHGNVNVSIPSQLFHEGRLYKVSVYLVKSAMPKADGTIYVDLVSDVKAYRWGCPTPDVPSTGMDVYMIALRHARNQDAANRSRKQR